MATKVKTTSTQPGAWVVNSKDRGRKSIKNGKVYLSDKEEFQIELYNPLQKCVLADIKLNGSSISTAGLVLNPGQRFYLDCFIEDNKKFIFNTYEVENTDEAIQAIAKNGLLEVKFYEEKVNMLSNWGIRNNYPWGRVFYDGPWYNTNNIYYGSGTVGGNYCATNTTGGGDFYCSTFTSGNVTLTSSNSGSITLDSNLLGNTNTTRISNNIETGRVDKGAKSDQKFESVDMDFNSYVISSIIITLLPESRKPLEVKDIKKTEVIQEKENVIELIAKLAELHKVGILTDDEFKTKKVELLSKI